MIQKIRRQFEKIRGQKHHTFDDLDPIVRRCLKDYGHLFPKHRINRDGSRVVYHFGIDELSAISLEKEHGSREYVPSRYAKMAMAGIEDLLTYIEQSPEPSKTEPGEGPGGSSEDDPGEGDLGGDHDGDEKGDDSASDEGPGVLPRAELPDGNS